MTDQFDCAFVTGFREFSFQSGQLGHSANTIILKSNEHKSYALVFGVICTFQSSQFFERLSMHFGVVDHIRASALITADQRQDQENLSYLCYPL
jgi:hypothetical protein